MSWLRAIGKMLAVIGVIAVLQLIFLQGPVLLLMKYVGTWAGFTYLGILLVIMIGIGAKFLRESNRPGFF